MFHDLEDQNSFTIIWKIENFDYSYQGKWLHSPAFCVETIDRTEWFLSMGSEEEQFSFFLNRKNHDNGPEIVAIDIELSFLAADGSTLLRGEMENVAFVRGSSHGMIHFAPRNIVLGVRRSEFIPFDTLTVRWRILKIEQRMTEAGLCFLHSRIAVERRAFTWNIQEFDSLVSGQNVNTVLEVSSPRIPPFIFNFIVESEKTGEIQIGQNDTASPTVLECKMTLLGEEEQPLDFEKATFMFDQMRGLQIWQFPSHMINRKLKSLPNNTLSLRCECGISDGMQVSEVRSIRYGSSSYIGLCPSEIGFRNTRDYCIKQKLPTSPFSLQSDLQLLLKDCILTDTTLKVESETFHVHKSILVARSPVFRAMFTSGMEEKATDVVEISDLDLGTVRRLLMYIYSDSLEAINWDCAAKLFSAADKYRMSSLKQMCSNYLKSSLCAYNACAVLTLANLHNDKDLKEISQQFIIDHDDYIFGTEAWEKVMSTNAQLAAETMNMKYKTKRIKK